MALSGVVACQQSASPDPNSELHKEFSARAEQSSRGEALVLSGIQKYREANYEAAAKELTEAISLSPQSAQGWMALGMTEAARDRFFEAAQAFHRASVILPDRYEPHFNLGLVLDTAGIAKRATEEYERALVLEPDNLETQENLARCLIVNDLQPDRARQLIERSLELELRPGWRQWLERQLRTLDEKRNVPGMRPATTLPIGENHAN